MSGQRQIVKEQNRAALLAVLDKHGYMPHRTLAKILMNEYPHLFTNLDAARTIVRNFFGAHGQFHRQNEATKQQAAKYTVAPVEWPESITEWKWEPYILPQLDGFWLIIADLHVPFHEMQPILAMVKYAKKLGKELKGILINGDLMDQYTQSWWSIDPKLITWDSELMATRSFMAKLRHEFPKTMIVWKWSNHEYRFERVVLNMKPELATSDTIRSQLHLLNCLKSGGNEKIFERVKVIEHENIVQFKDLAILHGNEFGRGVTTPVNPARTAFLRSKACCFVNHSHQSSQHAEQNLWGVQIVTRSGGCFCNMNPRWNRTAYLKWNWGFALLETRGKWDIQNKRIMGDEVVTA